MLKIAPPNFQFCPFCGKKLRIRIEEERKRKFCSSCQWTYYPHVATAVAAVIIKNNKVLMVKKKREPYKNTWMFPAGFIDFGEHPTEALKREVKEETGLKVEAFKLLEILQAEDDYRSLGHFAFFYETKVSGSKLQTDTQENQSIAWFDIKKSPKIGWKTHKYIMKLLQDKKFR